MPVKKAVIPAAGLGTRFLPVTKSVPKELLPILDRPMLQYVVEEAVEGGVEEVIVVTAPGKEGIASYFQSSPARWRDGWPRMASSPGTAGKSCSRRRSMAQCIFRHPGGGPRAWGTLF